MGREIYNLHISYGKAYENAHMSTQTCAPDAVLVPQSRWAWGIRGDDDLEGLIKSQLTLPSSMVTSVVTSTIITTRLEGPQIQLTRCLLTGCTAVNFDYEEIANPVPDRKYLQVNTVPYTYFVLNLALVGTGTTTSGTSSKFSI